MELLVPFFFLSLAGFDSVLIGRGERKWKSFVEGVENDKEEVKGRLKAVLS